MLRLVCCLMVLAAGFEPARAADPQNIFQNFMGTIQQFQQLEQQHRQQKELDRQQREVFVHQMVTACMSHDEVACQQIIDAKGMSPFANYTAFVHMGDIELQRGDRDGARSSYGHAMRWATRMQNGSGPYQAAAGKLAAASQERATTSTGSLPPTNYRSAAAGAPKGDVVCDAAGAINWKIACLQSSQDPDGAKLYAALGDTLRQHNTIFRELMECEATLAKQPDVGLKCYTDRGLSGEALETTRQLALEYDLMIDARLNAKR